MGSGIPMGARPSGFKAPPTVKDDVAHAYPFRC